MTVISNITSPGFPTQVVAESPVRAPLAGDIAWATPTLAIPLGFDAQVRPVPASCVELLGGVNHGVNSQAGRDI
jgi:hypothetical protein